MASYPVQRTVRAALAATAVLALAGGMSLPQAVADPVPPNASEALKKYNELSTQAEKLNEEHLRAQDDLSRAEGELDRANRDLTDAQHAQDLLRGQVDLLTEATFEGARFNQLSAILVSDSQQDFLNRMSALGILAGENAEAMDGLTAAVDKANDAARRATEAAGNANKAIEDIGRRKTALDEQITEARDAYRALPESERDALGDEGFTGHVPVPAGQAGQALAFALGERGKPYVYGSNGPDSWDCSSLMQAAYRSVGIAIPRTTYGQATIGRAVSLNEVKAGDLVIYYADQHHVSMAIDGIRAVHASTEGVPVKIQDIESIGPINTIRRVVG
ncbi:cell wall-associated NlpC family hydrolase [Saccharothrix tamanrassetensis]|uniref:Cell wall-associated NlpC family hydrolase n=1 Tax=Saccharothrix tamanrassetensis TaxID=1051531 RepID=A0A841CVP2_9PSEU|nr:NlpC/P60 family protein [Saccharothrix tamanrassetensis]MBB5960208.1 cell wall-associated NlpC family hydrolase [Saccharothrix tamanrassetensis]